MTLTAEPTFTALKALLTPYQQSMIVVHDTPEHYYLDTTHRMPNKKSLFFAAVKIGKTDVSFYLMPVYVFPELLTGISAELKKRMQGKSCFHFTQLEPSVATELKALIARGVERYQAAGYLK